MKTLLSILFVGMWMAMSSEAFAKPIEVKSENFVLIGDVNEKSAKRLVSDLEEFRGALVSLFSQRPLPEAIPVRIYVSDRTKELTLINSRDWSHTGGVFTTTLDGPIFILNSKNAFAKKSEARHIALHEFTHHLLAGYTQDIYPQWYNEGLANYLASFEKTGPEQYKIGRPKDSYMYALRRKKWMPMETVLSSVREYPWKPGDNGKAADLSKHQFYAQSWLAVHYMQSKPGFGDMTTTYIRLINEGEKPLPAFEQAYKISPKEFEKQLREYYRINKFQRLTLNLGNKLAEKPLKVRELSKGEAALRLGETMYLFNATPKKAPAILKQFETAEKILGETPDVLVGKAKALSYLGKWTEAVSLAERALVLDPTHVQANLTIGTVLIHKNKRLNTPNQAEIIRARKYIKTAMALDSENMSAHYFYARTFTILKDKPNSQAVASAKYAMSYYKNLRFLRHNLILASVLLRAGDFKETQDVIDRAIIWGDNKSTRTIAEKMKAGIKG